MRILVLGGNGRLGHRLWLAARDRHETWATFRGRLEGQPWATLFDRRRAIEDVRGNDLSSLDRALATARPDVVINALGLVKQRPDGADAGPAFVANCLVPQYVSHRCSAAGIRLIQVSTDCVFSGSKGSYSETDEPDAFDVYGLTKRLGEVGGNHLTVRTSFIGRNLSGSEGLLEWFLSQHDRVNGYRHAIFSGMTAEFLAQTLISVAEDHPRLAGLRHLAASPIDKYELLCRLAAAFDTNIDVIPTDEPRIDRSLDDRQFRDETGIPHPSWDEMIGRLASDPTPYEQLRGTHAG